MAGSTMSACRAWAFHQGSWDDDRFGALPCLHQPVEILVVMKRVTAAPVDETDVGILQALPVVVERFPGVSEACR